MEVQEGSDRRVGRVSQGVIIKKERSRNEKEEKDEKVKSKVKVKKQSQK